ncbi:vWA domain-containing protein, partial [Legionella maceachernii]|uniref:vWA domain-containing protein n=3 Tax=Legionellaceae TaxID=444 RepID=UPI001F2883E7
MFELIAPWVLLGLPLPLLIWFLVPRAVLRLPLALKVPFYQAMIAVMGNKKTAIAGKAQMSMLFVIWCLLVFAASGPRWVGEPQPLTREGRNIMLALDLSGSMELADMLVKGRPVSRLDVVKRAAEQFVQARAGDRIGLILFGTRAYLQTPLTYDRQNVLLRLEDATV